jgi:tetratricopeptide (TPR) repeat protein
VAALDVWAVVKENLAHRGGEQVLVVARLADDEPWRQRLRDPAVRENGAVLENLALEEGVLAQPSISLFLMSKMLDEAGRPAAAESLLRRAQQRYPTEFWIHQSLGELLREFGPVSERSVRLAESVGCSRAALALRPRSAGTHYNLGSVLYEQKRLEDAKVEFRRAIELNPGLAGPSFNSLGIVLREQGNLEEAGANFRKAIALKTDYVDALSNLGLVLEEQGRLEEAEAELRKAVALKLDYVAHKHLGDILRKQGKPKEAEAEYRKAVAIKPDDCGSHSDLGSFLGEQGRLKEAEAEFRKAISLVPNGANVHWTLGNRISLESNGADVHWNFGTALIRLGNLDEAEAEIRKGIALKPNQAPAYAVLGSVLIGLGKLVQAEAEYRKAIALQPDDAAAHMDLGSLLRDLGKLDEAEAEVREAVALKPDYAAAHMNLDNVLLAKQQREETIQEYRRAIELDPKLAQVHCNLGVVLRETGKLTESLDAFRRGHRLGSGQPGWTYPSAQWVQEAESLVELDPKLTAILDGKKKPADDAERLALARLCQQPFKKLYAAASRFFAEAFAHDAKLAEDLQTGDRYNAACTAALAGCGRGADAPVAVADRAPLRAQALKWLQADLAAWKPQTKSLLPAVRTPAVNALAHWREDDDLAGVRGADALMKLPEAERQEWQKLWADLDALLPKTKP